MIQFRLSADLSTVLGGIALLYTVHVYEPIFVECIVYNLNNQYLEYLEISLHCHNSLQYMTCVPNRDGKCI